MGSKSGNLTGSTRAGCRTVRKPSRRRRPCCWTGREQGGPELAARSGRRAFLAGEGQGTHGAQTHSITVIHPPKSMSHTESGRRVRIRSFSV